MLGAVTLPSGNVSMDELAAGDHVCWVVDDPADYLSTGARLIAGGHRLRRKPVVFGPHDSDALAQLGAGPVMAVDPYLTFFGRGPVHARVMRVAFRELCELALAEGYEGVLVISDMSWLRPARPSAAEIAALEIVIDRAARELPATLVCAYRRTSFDTAGIMGALSVHLSQHGADDRPPFRLGAADGGTWQLAGEVDLAESDTFEAAFGAALSLGECVVDMSRLTFVDVAAVRAIASAARRSEVAVQLRAAPASLRRLWQLTGLAASVPLVSFLR